jgi:integrase
MKQATKILQPNGRYRIDIPGTDGKRPRVRLGTKSENQADIVLVKINDVLEGNPGPKTIEWLVKQRDRRPILYKRIVKAIPQAADYCAPVAAPVKAATVGELFTRYFSVLNVKQSTLDSYEHMKKRILAYFVETTALSEIDEFAPEKWRKSMIDSKLSAATIGKCITFARTVFAKAVRWKMVDGNPFDGLIGKGGKGDKSRKFHVDRELTAKAMDAMPDAELRLIIALCRFAGLRCPSEIMPLKWGDAKVKRDENGNVADGSTLFVTSPKTERHEGHESRVIPFFAELDQPFKDVCGNGKPADEYVITQYRGSNGFLAINVKRALRRAGIKPWPRLFNNLRASRDTELSSERPAHVAAAWMGKSVQEAELPPDHPARKAAAVLGHSVKVSAEHYVTVRDSDFSEAIADSHEKSVRKVTQTTPDIPRQPQTESDDTVEMAVSGGVGEFHVILGKP